MGAVLSAVGENKFKQVEEGGTTYLQDLNRVNDCNGGLLTQYSNINIECSGDSISCRVTEGVGHRSLAWWEGASLLPV